jgi:hypothetical protein
MDKPKHISIENLPKQHIFRVPENYFEELPQKILAQLDDSTLQAPKEQVFGTPNDYFETLASKIQQRVGQEDFLNKLPKELVFKTPGGYFDELPERIETRLDEYLTRESIGITWSRRRSWLAVAASVLIGVLGWFTFQPKQDELGSEALAKVPKTELINYLVNQGLNEQEILNHSQYINLQQNTLDSAVAPLNVPKEDLIKHLSQEDIDDLI